MKQSFAKCIFGVALGAIALCVAGAPTWSKGAHACHDLAALTEAFEIVLPHATRTVLQEADATVYMREFNQSGKKSNYAGDTVLVNHLDQGHALITPIAKGKGCHHYWVPRHIHRAIMVRVVRARA